MQSVKLDTGFNIEVDFPISPFHKRFFAWIIDVVVMVSYSWLTNRLFGFLISPFWRQIQWLAVLVGLPILFYHLLFEISFNGQSIGKMAMSIRVITIEGGQPSISQYLIRWVFRLADFPVWILPAIVTNELPWWCSLLLFSGLACLLLTEKSQRIGDLVAGTIVFDTRTSTSWQDTVFTELDAGYQPRHPEVMRLSDKDVNTLKSIIVTVQKKNDLHLAEKISDRIKSKLQISSEQEPADFLETLLKDYNYYSGK